MHSRAEEAMTTEQSRMYALFDGNNQISKAHSTKEAVAIEAFEKKLVIDFGADFIGDKSGRCLPEGFAIKEVL